MGTDWHGNTGYDTSYACGERSKLSKPKMGIFINKENNKHPCAGAQKAKLLPKPKWYMFRGICSLPPLGKNLNYPNLLKGKSFTR